MNMRESIEEIENVKLRHLSQVNMEDARCTIIHEAPWLWQEHGYKISILFRLNL